MRAVGIPISQLDKKRLKCYLSKETKVISLLIPDLLIFPLHSTGPCFSEQRASHGGEHREVMPDNHECLVFPGTLMIMPDPGAPDSST